MTKQNNECQGYYEVSGYTTSDGKKVDSYVRNCWKHGDSTSDIGVQNTQESIKNTIKIIENILKQKTVTDEDIAKINNQNQMTIHNLFDDLEDLSVQKSNLPEIPTVESVEQSKVIEHNSKQLKENVYQAILMLNLSKQALDKNWKKLHIKDGNDEMYKYINKKEEIEKLSNITDKLLKETSNINEKTLNNVQKLREETGLIRFKPMLPLKNTEQEQKWIWPCKSKIITSSHGYRIHPIFKKRIFHDGIDISESNNKPVWAVVDGKIIKAQWNGGYGNYIEIDHGNGLHSFYGHLNSYNVKVGDYVRQGQEIGKVGSTGRSTGNHLHFGVRKNNQSVNPLNFLPKVR